MHRSIRGQNKAAYRIDECCQRSALFAAADVTLVQTHVIVEGGILQQQIRLVGGDVYGLVLGIEPLHRAGVLRSGVGTAHEEDVTARFE